MAHSGEKVNMIVAPGWRGFAAPGNFMLALVRPKNDNKISQG